MAWFRFDDKFHSHPRTLHARSLNRDAPALFAFAGSWSCDVLTDGDVPRWAVHHLGYDDAAADALVEAGLWVATPLGWAFAKWDEYGQPTKASVRAARDAWKAKKAKQRKTSERGAETGRFVSPGDSPVSQSQSQSQTNYQTTASSDVASDPHEALGEMGEAMDSGHNAKGDLRRRRKPETPMPADWKPTASHQERAAHLGLDIEREWVKFREHAEMNDRRCRSWNAAFAMWLTRAAEYHAAEAARNAQRASRRQGPADRAAGWEAIVEKFAAEDGIVAPHEEPGGWTPSLLDGLDDVVDAEVVEERAA